MADFILHMPPRFFARVFGNPAGDPVLLKSRGVTLLRDRVGHSLAQILLKRSEIRPAELFAFKALLILMTYISEFMFACF